MFPLTSVSFSHFMTEYKTWKAWQAPLRGHYQLSFPITYCGQKLEMLLSIWKQAYKLLNLKYKVIPRRQCQVVFFSFVETPTPSLSSAGEMKPHGADWKQIDCCTMLRVQKLLVSIPKLQFTEQGKVNNNVTTHTLSTVLNSFPTFTFTWRLGKSSVVKWTEMELGWSNCAETRDATTKTGCHSVCVRLSCVRVCVADIDCSFICFCFFPLSLSLLCESKARQITAELS